MPTIKKQSFTKATALNATPSSKNHGVLAAMNDEDLMSQFQMGTVEAFDILVGRYHDPLTNYIYRFLGDMKECEDLLQETFLRVYRNRHSYRRIAKFSTWLYTIAGNLARSEYRKRKRRRLYSLSSVNRDDEEYEVAALAIATAMMGRGLGASTVASENRIVARFCPLSGDPADEPDILCQLDLGIVRGLLESAASRPVSVELDVSS